MCTAGVLSSCSISRSRKIEKPQKYQKPLFRLIGDTCEINCLQKHVFSLFVICSQCDQKVWSEPSGLEEAKAEP